MHRLKGRKNTLVVILQSKSLYLQGVVTDNSLLSRKIGPSNCKILLKTENYFSQVHIVFTCLLIYHKFSNIFQIKILSSLPSSTIKKKTKRKVAKVYSTPSCSIQCSDFIFFQCLSCIRMSPLDICKFENMDHRRRNWMPG